MAASSFRSNLKATVLFGAAGVVLFAATDGVETSIRNAIHDALKPGQIGLVRIVASSRQRFATLTESNQPTELNRVNDELQAWKLRYRRLQLAHVDLREKNKRLKKHGVPISAASSTEPLLVVELLNANVLGDTASAIWRSGKLIDVGRSNGVEESALVIQGDGLLIDQGKDAEITEDLPVYCGRCVVGKIEHAGRWSSTVQVITDERYRELVTLARRTPAGLVYGSQGQLEGTGHDGCRLTLISADEPVSVGDAVYSIPSKGLVDYPMLYGTVTRAELKPGSMHWSIFVKPAITIDEVHAVQVLQSRINPVRMLGN